MFPTETVYGVGCDAGDEAAVERVFVAKGRPPERAVTIHLGRHARLEEWAAGSTEAARRLADAFWPGPLTLVVPAGEEVSAAVRGGGATVGLRVPDHPLTLELLDGFGRGIVGSSANRHGESPPTTADHARATLGDAVDVYLDGGRCRLGVGSTVVDVTGPIPVVLRQGALAVGEVRRVLGVEVQLA